MEDNQSPDSDPPKPIQQPIESGVSLEQPDLQQSAVRQSGALGTTPNAVSAVEQTSWLRRLASSLPKKVVIGILAILVLVGCTAIYLGSRSQPAKDVRADDFKTQRVSFSGLSTQPATSTTQKLTVNGQLQIAHSLVLSPSVQPTVGVAGQLYYDQAGNTLAYYNGSRFVTLAETAGTTVTINNITNNATINNLQGGGGAAGNTVNGTPGQLVKFTGATTIGNSIASESGSVLTVTGNVNLQTLAAAPLPDVSIWGASSELPAIINNNELENLELGVKFKTSVSGYIKSIRFYKGNLNTGTHTGSLWSVSGTELARATFTNETASGWQQVDFATPVAVAADTTYTASYHTNSNYYSADVDYFKINSKANGPLALLRDGDDGGNGTYAHSATPAFPGTSFRSTNYWIDVIFAPNPPPNQYQVNGVQLSSSDLSNNNDLAKRGSSQAFTGNNTFRPGTDSISGFSVQSADGTPQFTVSASESRIYIGSRVGSEFSPTLLVLSNKIFAGDPAGTDGAIYFNAALKSFRCFRSGTWDNCAQPEVDHSFSAYEEFLGGQNTSFATDNFGSLGWHAQAIGANGSLAYDPVTPAPVADRPGILALQTPAVANQGTTLLLGNSGGTLIAAKDNIVKTAVAVSSTNQVLRIGLHNETTATATPTSGVWWEANASTDPNWRYCSGDGTTPTCASSNVPITANTWVRLELRVTATGAGISAFDAGINGVFYNPVGLTIDTINRISPAMSCYTTTSTAQSCYWDYYQLKGTTGGAR